MANKTDILNMICEKACPFDVKCDLRPPKCTVRNIVSGMMDEIIDSVPENTTNNGLVYTSEIVEWKQQVRQ